MPERVISGREPPDILTRFAPLNPMRWSKMTILRNMLWYRALRMSSFGGSWAGTTKYTKYTKAGGGNAPASVRLRPGKESGKGEDGSQIRRPKVENRRKSEGRKPNEQQRRDAAKTGEAGGNEEGTMKGEWSAEVRVEASPRLP